MKVQFQTSRQDLPPNLEGGSLSSLCRKVRNHERVTNESATALTANAGATLAPLELVSAHPRHRFVFTTYALSLSFFESVILDAIVRGGGRESLILADVEGVGTSLSEQGAHRVGKDYDVEPVSVSGGVFHPKISVVVAREECHLLVGSGNLIFGGWGGKLRSS